ncbi:hypothetical protein GDO81_029865 [Engystomops pustulosus]|uniref:Uncharacterized protein n=1 Tax=Engystomops pustulosus TaxID=76066 RepID=A0AAV6YI37_ENGPU|nr:hypothetical protein GDO81_029865 [Engystomops pustulosus]
MGSVYLNFLIILQGACILIFLLWVDRYMWEFDSLQNMDTSLMPVPQRDQCKLFGLPFSFHFFETFPVQVLCFPSNHLNPGVKSPTFLNCSQN